MKEKMSKLFETMRTTKNRKVVVGIAAAMATLVTIGAFMTLSGCGDKNAPDKGGESSGVTASQSTVSSPGEVNNLISSDTSASVVSETESTTSSDAVSKAEDKDSSKDTIVSKDDASSKDTDSKVTSEKATSSKTDTTSKKETVSKDTASDKVASKVTSSKKENTSKGSSAQVTSSKVNSSKSEVTSSKEPSTHKHSYKSKVVKPTCTKGGYTKHTCKCGESYKDKKTDKLGHLYTDWEVTKKATTKSTGIKERKCERCGKVSTKTIAKKKSSSDSSSEKEYVQRADTKTGISYDGKSKIIYTYPDGTTGTTPKVGATYDAGLGRTSTVTEFNMPDYEPEPVSDKCAVCGKKMGKGTNGTCVRWLMSDVTCKNCGEKVPANTCHTCK